MGCGVDHLGCGVANLGCGVAHLGCGVAHLGCGVAHLECGVDHLGCGVDHLGCGVDHLGCGVAHLGCGVTHLGCGVAHWLPGLPGPGFESRPGTLRDSSLSNSDEDTRRAIPYTIMQSKLGFTPNKNTDPPPKKNSYGPLCEIKSNVDKPLVLNSDATCKDQLREKAVHACTVFLETFSLGSQKFPTL